MNTLGGKPIRKHILCPYMLETYSVILDFIFHNIILYLYWLVALLDLLL